MKTLINASLFTSLVFATFLGISQQQASAQNPIVGGSSSSSISYDPFNDHTYVNNTNNTVRQSFFDANRNNIDPGSYKYVDRYFRDSNGQLVHEYGHTWTSFGKPHGNLTRDKVATYYPTPTYPGCHHITNGGVTIHQQDNVAYSHVNPNYGGTTVHNSDNVLYSQPFPGNSRPNRGGTTIRDRENVAYSVIPKGGKSNNNRRGGFTNRFRKNVQFKNFIKRK